MRPGAFRGPSRWPLGAGLTTYRWATSQLYALSGRRTSGILGGVYGHRKRRPPGVEGEGGEKPTVPRREKTPEERRDDLIAYAFRALAGRALSEAELRAKLQRRSDDEALVEDILARVRDLGYQDDTQVARAENARRGVGAFRVRQTLKRRGLDEAVIQETLESRDPDQEQEAVLELLERRWPTFMRKKDPAASAYAFLARRGFSGTLIWPAIREMQERAGLEGAGEDPDES